MSKQVQLLVVDCGSSKVPLIKEKVLANNAQVKIIPSEFVKQTDLIDVTGVIISGAPILLTETDPEKYIERLTFIFESNLPVLGICFGHQCLGIYHGATISRSIEDRDWNEIEIFEQSDLVEANTKRIKMMEDHCEEISLPPNFRHIARSSNCEIEFIQHKSKPHFGVQFHPESSGEQGTQFIRNFITVCQKHR